VGLALVATLAVTGVCSAQDIYPKRARELDASIRDRLLGKWTNPVDFLVVEIDEVDLKTGAIRGKEWPTEPFTPQSSPAGTVHDIVGWVSAAPEKPGADNVIPVSFSTSLVEYGTLPVWAGFLRDDKIVTMHYLVWPVKTYPWDHISAYQETWTKLP
jgi:hypothetical protein